MALRRSAIFCLNLNMNKSEIRKLYLAKRKGLPIEELMRMSEEIFKNFIAEFKPVTNQKVHCFLSITDKHEVNTVPFLNYFFTNSIRVFVPKIVDGKMISLEINSDTRLVKNSWGIAEPESSKDSGESSFDFVLVPLLYADRSGNRVGYGKGFYDTFFATVNANAFKIGLNFFSPAEEISDVWENDVSLDYLVTPTEVLSFAGGTSKFTK
ncbi:5-formyltetrahydrofolate cyclo-ligase [Flavobacteriaceae bacterium 3519-10]|nr:5-formyltetrahydrofolate cyclo-ligase [Flavobacteriaceae bacterium 3519-10]